MRWPSVCRLWLPVWLDDPDAALSALENDLMEAERDLDQREHDAVEVAVGERTADPPAQESAPFHLSDFERAVLDDHPVELPEAPPDREDQPNTLSASGQAFRAWQPAYIGRDALDDLSRYAGRIRPRLHLE